ncbi:MAG: glucose-6-phosphate isomerase [Alphaproteobacteria bacterium]|nr:glucose-6-phosphate isomerase [Alphaproteobacteria bacterium]
MSNNPTHKPEWAELQKHSQNLMSHSIADLFESDPDRVDQFSFDLDGLFVDFSKQHMTRDALDTLINLSRRCSIEEKRDEMFAGGIVNTTENRAVLHTALRRAKTDEVFVGEHNVIPEIHTTFKHIQKFSEKIRLGNYKGETGKPIKHIVSLGVGGSELGPRLVCNALDTEKQDKDALKIHFVSNIDPVDISRVFKNCPPEETVFVVTSKSFTTQETLTNALAAKEWVQGYLPKESSWHAHFVAVSANVRAAQGFGIAEDQIFPMWEWVNGRFSLWSAVGLPVILAHGFEVFQELLRGAHTMDEHFQNARLEKNIPVLLALVGIWNNNFLSAQAHAVLPYAQKLQDLPRYLQQLEMESNGKSIDLDGLKITDYKTCPVIFGEAGTIGQHSFYQLLHQGTGMVSCDFIGVVEGRQTDQNHHKLLLSNMLAQGQALMQGQEADESYCDFAGSKPSTTILIDMLDAYHLGMLLALYEHKTFIQGIIWNINSFDQFGVELGKEMSRKLENNDLTDADASTQALFSRVNQ